MKRKTLSEQMKHHANSKPKKHAEYKGDISQVISTGSTLLDLAISGGRRKGGGIPRGILIEVSGPESSGKTVLLCVIAGNVKKLGGQVMFRDPEYRLDTQFARIFGMNVDEIDYDYCKTVPDLFKPVRTWAPKPDDKIHGIFADSLAALSTNMELEDKDKTGMRRAKEFSEECRKSCSVLTEKGYIMVCSNHLRENVGGGDFAPKYRTPGGRAIGYYSSLRLRITNVKDIKVKRAVRKTEITRVIGVLSTIKVMKSSVWKPKREATVPIIYDTGIDDIRANLTFIRDVCAYKTYKMLDGTELSRSIYDAKKMIKDKKLTNKLKDDVIELWEEIEAKFIQI
jgi:recombination protein RecA